MGWRDHRSLPRRRVFQALEMGMREVVFVLFLTAVAWSMAEAVGGASPPNDIHSGTKRGRLTAGMSGQSS